MAGKNTLEGLPQLFKVIVYSGDDYGDILRGEGWLVRNFVRLVAPMGKGMNDQTKVAMDPMEQSV